MDAPFYHLLWALNLVPWEAPFSRSPIVGRGWAHAGRQWWSPTLHHGEQAGPRLGLQEEPSSALWFSNATHWITPCALFLWLPPWAPPVPAPASSSALGCGEDPEESSLDVKVRLSHFCQISLTCPLELQWEGNGTIALEHLVCALLTLWLENGSQCQAYFFLFFPPSNALCYYKSQ